MMLHIIVFLISCHVTWSASSRTGVEYSQHQLLKIEMRISSVEAVNKHLAAENDRLGKLVQNMKTNQNKVKKQMEQIMDTLEISRETHDAMNYPIVASESPACECPEEPVRNCYDILQRDPEARTGIHIIDVGEEHEPRMIIVNCDMDTDGGGWTLIQRRRDGSTNFHRDSRTYAEGFGLMAHEFWLGNDNIHDITSQRNFQLRIELENVQEENRYAEYNNFAIENKCQDYRFNAHGYSGDAGDALTYNNRMAFSTFDQDLDSDRIEHCAAAHAGAWWHNNCTAANLNGNYLPGGVVHDTGVFWYPWEEHRSLKTTEMKIRPTLSTCSLAPKNCHDILHDNPLAQSGRYSIYFSTSVGITKRLTVFCDMDTDGGGWTVFQRRIDGSVDFFQNYQSYIDGFGDVTGEFWLGNENLHLLTNGCDQDLRFDLMDENNDRHYAQYASFHVGSYDDGYRVDFTTYSGTAGDAFTYNNGMMFTTYDRDQDTRFNNCAEIHQGAWWHKNCTQSILNSRHYAQSPASSQQGLRWWGWTGSGSRDHMRFTEMKIRPSTLCHH